VYDDPASLFVAGFIGSPAMNFLPGKRVGGEVDVGEGVRVPMPAALQDRGGEAVTVGVRPEHFVAAGGAGPVLNLHVDTVEALGADSLLHCMLGPTPLVVRVDGHDTPAPGSTIAVSAMPGKTYFFDTGTGKRL